MSTSQKEICESVLVYVAGGNTRILTPLTKTNICRYISEGTVSQVTKESRRIFAAIKDEEIYVSPIVEVGGDYGGSRSERFFSSEFCGLSYIREGSISVIAKQDIWRAGNENVEIAVMVEIEKRARKM